MNPAETNAAILVMAAFSNQGKEIEYLPRYGGTRTRWKPADPPEWNWLECEYRVKPEPKKIWASITKDGLVLTATSIKPNAALAHNYREFVEVLEGGS